MFKVFIGEGFSLVNIFFNTTNVGYICIPTDKEIYEKIGKELLLETNTYNFIGQVTTQWKGILYSAAIALVFSFLFMWFIGKCGVPLFYFFILTVNLGLWSAAIILFRQG